MRKMKFLNKLKQENGSGLVLALMVLLVLSVLGASLGAITIGSLQLSDVNHDTNSAYYIAEAGVNVAYKEFEKIVKEASKHKNQNDFYTEINEEKDGIHEIISNLDFEPQFGDKPGATVVIESQGNDNGDKRSYTIHSTGEVDDKKRTVKKEVIVQWVEKEGIESSLEIPAHVAIISTRRTIIEGGEVKGYVYMNNPGSDQIEVGGTIAGSLFINNQVEELEFILEENGAISGNVYINSSKRGVSSDVSEGVISGKVIIDYNKKYEGYKIDFGPLSNYIGQLEQKVKTIAYSKENSPDLKEGANLKYAPGNFMDWNLKTDAKIKTLTMSGAHNKINIGSNNIILAMDQFIHKDSAARTLIEGTEQGQLTIVVKDKIEFINNGNSIFNSNEKNVRFVLTGKDKEINIEEKAVVNAQIIAPYSKVIIKDSAEVNGIIIAEEVIIEDNGKVNDFKYSINSSGTGESGEGGDYKITPGPAIEVD